MCTSSHNVAPRAPLNAKTSHGRGQEPDQMRALGARFSHQRRHQRAQEKRNKSGREAVLACGMEFDVRGGGGASRTRRGLATDGPGAMTMQAPKEERLSRCETMFPSRVPLHVHIVPSTSNCVPFFPEQIDLGPGHVAFWRVPMETWVCPSSRHVPIEFASFLDSLSLRSPWFPTKSHIALGHVHVAFWRVPVSP